MRKEAFLVGKKKNGRYTFVFKPPVKNAAENGNWSEQFDKLSFLLNKKKMFDNGYKKEPGYFTEINRIEDDGSIGKFVLQVTHSKPFTLQEIVDFYTEEKYKVIELKPETEKHFGDILRSL